MQIVVAHGADVNNTGKDTCPVFLAACEIASQAEEACLSLLEKGADPNGKNEVRSRRLGGRQCTALGQNYNAHNVSFG